MYDLKYTTSKWEQKVVDSKLIIQKQAVTSLIKLSYELVTYLPINYLVIVKTE